MDIEYEATFINIDKDEIKTKLKKAGAKLMRKSDFHIFEKLRKSYLK